MDSRSDASQHDVPGVGCRVAVRRRSGRGKVVALENVFANPYVNMAEREQDRYGMEERLLENDRAGYCARAARYKVEYMITDAKRGDLTVPRETFFKELYAADGIRVWQAPACGSPYG